MRNLYLPLPSNVAIVLKPKFIAIFGNRAINNLIGNPNFGSVEYAWGTKYDNSHATSPTLIAIVAEIKHKLIIKK